MPEIIYRNQDNTRSLTALVTKLKVKISKVLVADLEKRSNRAEIVFADIIRQWRATARDLLGKQITKEQSRIKNRTAYPRMISGALRAHLYGEAEVSKIEIGKSGVIASYTVEIRRGFTFFKRPATTNSKAFDYAGHLNDKKEETYGGYRKRLYDRLDQMVKQEVSKNRKGY